jgi:hypothetical protein
MLIQDSEEPYLKVNNTSFDLNLIANRGILNILVNSRVVDSIKRVIHKIGL